MLKMYPLHNTLADESTSFICESKYLYLPLGGSRTRLNSQITLVSESKYQQANQSIMVKARDVFIMMSVLIALLIAQL